MKITFYPDEDAPARAARCPYFNADHVIVEGACPVCKATPFSAGGVKGTMARGHDTFEARAGCLVCGVVSGKLVVKVDTIFGIEEDERVLHGRARVY